ncbi:alpha/beta fold hydrolase [Rhizosphaericola mali]|nr:alpha/beta hydrolase [Rhizosphaericola mali]
MIKRLLLSLLILGNSLLYAQGNVNWNYKDKYQTVEGVNIHYIKTGTGTPVLLLHGFPENIYTWRYIVPELSKKHTIIAIDLPGIGKSAPPKTGYDQTSIAHLLHSFMEELGYKKTAIVAHDLGVEIAYGYASEYPKDVTQVACLDVPIATEQMETLPVLSKENRVFWWFAFHNVDNLPEELVKGRERIYIKWFYDHGAYNKKAFNDNTVTVYAKSYASPGVFHNSLGYYRAMIKNIEINKEIIKRKLEMPVLALGGEKSFGMKTLYSFQPLCTNVSGGEIKDCGHFIQEEQPSKLLEYLIPFLGK